MFTPSMLGKHTCQLIGKKLPAAQQSGAGAHVKQPTVCRRHTVCQMSRLPTQNGRDFSLDGDEQLKKNLFQRDKANCENTCET